jgi:hypothetical protein
VIDHQALDECLTRLETNQQQLVHALSMYCKSLIGYLFTLLHTDVHPQNLMAMMVSLEKRLQTVPDEDREHQFYAHTLRYLTTSSGRQVEREDWMITSYEVEFGHEIGSGGLYVLPLFSHLLIGTLAHRLFSSVVMCSKEVGTRRRWHSRCS